MAQIGSFHVQHRYMALAVLVSAFAPNLTFSEELPPLECCEMGSRLCPQDFDTIVEVQAAGSCQSKTFAVTAIHLKSHAHPPKLIKIGDAVDRGDLGSISLETLGIASHNPCTFLATYRERVSFRWLHTFAYVDLDTGVHPTHGERACEWGEVPVKPFLVAILSSEDIGEPSCKSKVDALPGMRCTAEDTAGCQMRKAPPTSATAFAGASLSAASLLGVVWFRRRLRRR